MTGQLIQPRDKVLSYIEGTLLHGLTKREAYLKYIDPDCKAPYAAISRMEKKKEFQDILAVITSDENFKFQVQTQKVKGKFLNLVEQNIDTAGKLLKKATDNDDPVSMGAAVRIANETVQAMAIVSGASTATPKQPGGRALDSSGVIS